MAINNGDTGLSVRTKMNALLFITDWDMSTEQFPTGSLRGQRYFGINGPTGTLVDRSGSLIPDGVFATSLSDNASISDPTQWALQYTIN